MAMSSHFTKQETGWFNEYHFMKMPNIANKVRKLHGNTKGPNSKMAWWISLPYPDVTNHWISKPLLDCISMFLISRHGSSFAIKIGSTSASGYYSFKEVLSNKIHSTCRSVDIQIWTGRILPASHSRQHTIRSS